MSLLTAIEDFALFRFLKRLFTGTPVSGSKCYCDHKSPDDFPGEFPDDLDLYNSYNSYNSYTEAPDPDYDFDDDDF